jgi:hypothetical protein
VHYFYQRFIASILLYQLQITPFYSGVLFHYKRRILCRRCLWVHNLTAKGNGFFALSDKYSEVYLVFMIQVLNFNAEENTNAERKIAYMRFPDIHFRNPGN